MNIEIKNLDNFTEDEKETFTDIKKYIGLKNEDILTANCLTLEDYLGRFGCASPVDDFMIDKLKIPHGETQNQKNQRLKQGCYHRKNTMKKEKKKSENII